MSEASGASSGSGPAPAYMKGSIRRIKLDNFMTYSKVEFEPGARLNLILGPNGTGKSCIVCAICIGLGGKESILGRGDKISAFIKRGERIGYTEIELHHPPRNYVIRRTLEKKDGSDDAVLSTWELNGKSTTKKDVLALLAKMGVQVDNLCQFLPQDKVGSFTQMNHQQLLKETEVAILDKSLITMHNKLIDLQKEEGTHVRLVDAKTQQVEEFKSEEDSLQTSVNNQKARIAMQEEAFELEQQMVWVESEKVRNEAVRAKEDYAQIKRELVQLEATAQPNLDRIAQLKHDIGTYQQAERDAKRAVSSAQMKHERVTGGDGKLYGFIEQMEDTADRKKKVTAKAEKAEKAANECRKKILRLQEDVDAVPSEEVRLAEREHNRKECHASQTKGHALRAEFEALKAAQRPIDVKIAEQGRKLENLSNQKLQKEQRIATKFPGAARARRWLDDPQNAQKFHRRVHGPIAMDVSVTGNAAKYLESAVNKKHQQMFVTESDADCSILKANQQHTGKIDIINIEGGAYRITENHDRGAHGMKRPYPAEKMAQMKPYGVVSCLDEQIEAPNAVKMALCKLVNIHKTLVGDAKTEAALTKNDPTLLNLLSDRDNPVMRGQYTICTPGTQYKQTISRYAGTDGKKTASVRTREMWNAQVRWKQCV
jgi:chromosome segregation ATPase